jgi:sulfoxide reductase heme-binding subunit YedZ
LKIVNALRVSRTGVWILASSPLVYLAVLVTMNALGPDPAKKLALLTGDWTLCGLLLTLFISTLGRYYPPARVLIRCRRVAGLWTFFYASLHLMVFIALYLGFDAVVLARELQKRPYITLGFLAWLVLLPLAITSSNYAVRALGKRWKVLHQWVYLALVFALCHVIWQIRSDWSNAFFFSLAGFLLLLERMRLRLNNNR